MNVHEGELKEFLLDSGLVAKREIDTAAEDAKGRGASLAEVLLARGALSEDALRKAQSYALGVPFVEIGEDDLSMETLALIPEPLARRFSAVALKGTDHAVEVAFLDLDALPAIERALGRARVVPRLTSLDSMKRALLRYQRFLKNQFGTAISVASKKLSGGTGDAALAIVDALLAHAILERASDIHIEPLAGELLVRYRIHGHLYEAMTLPAEASLPLVERVKQLAGMDVSETKRPQDGRFRMERAGEKVSFRVSTLPTAHGEKIVLRVLYESGEGFSLDSLGFHGTALERVHEALHARRGLILVSGPEGCGKTTTLYTLLDILNTPEKSLATIEERIEYRLPRVNQTQIDGPAGYTYPAAVRALSRQDTDVLMIAEIKDAETAALAASAANAGKLVLAGVSADSAASAMTALVALGADPELLASALSLSISSRLARRLAPPTTSYLLSRENRARIAPAGEFAAALAALVEEKLAPEHASIDALPFYRSENFQGKVGLHEVLPLSPALRELLAQEASSGALEARAKQEGMLSLLADGIYESLRGTTALEEAFRATRG